MPQRTVFNRVLNPMSEALLACGELVEARRWTDDSLAVVRGSNKIPVLIARAHIALAQGEPERAMRDAHDAVAIAADTRAFLRLPDAVECLADFSERDSDHLRAARLFAAADAIRDAKGIARFPMYRARCHAAIGSCREALGAEAFDAAWAQGAALAGCTKTPLAVNVRHTG